jgi:hypothetical protein
MSTTLRTYLTLKDTKLTVEDLQVYFGWRREFIPVLALPMAIFQSTLSGGVLLRMSGTMTQIDDFVSEDLVVSSNDV